MNGFHNVLCERLAFRRLLVWLVVIVPACLMNTQTVSGEMVESNYVGWGFALGYMSQSDLKLEYRDISVPTIKFNGSSSGGTASAIFFGKHREKDGHIILYQGEVGFSWIRQHGKANRTFYGYPATTEEEATGLLLHMGFALSYFKIWRAWFASGLEFYPGWVRERFKMHVYQEGNDICIYDYESKPAFLDYRANLMLLSAKILDKNWNSWELQFGYSWTFVRRDNKFRGYSLEAMTDEAETTSHGWYIQIRKLLLVDFNLKRMVEKKPEKNNP